MSSLASAKTSRDDQEGGKEKLKILEDPHQWATTKQVEKALKNGKQVFLCMIRVDLDKESSEVEINDESIVPILQEYEAVLPDKLPNGLPPPRDVDHKIEFVPRQSPPVKAAYRMDLTELQELKKQPQELLNMVYI
ncbi:hypothetical protein KP509_31G032700 [Ceratopteris richardii]|uniref:Uncharacterized protein n=1 Tax=Ceratopteris richardii TaxID=49495 RepID=A0A8T2QYW0_CERRI|nr:hypothetical protein KP509_31G032700 [Ceratopteris richardii]